MEIIDSPRPDERVFVDHEFQECSACAEKPGSPTLCSSCLHNRALISALQTSRKRKAQWLSLLRSMLDMEEA